MLPEPSSIHHPNSVPEQHILHADSAPPILPCSTPPNFACVISVGDHHHAITPASDLDSLLGAGCSQPVFVHVGSLYSLPAEQCTALFEKLSELPIPARWIGVDGQEAWPGKAIETAIRPGLSEYQAERLRQIDLESYIYWSPPNLDVALSDVTKALKRAGFRSYTVSINRQTYRELSSEEANSQVNPETIARGFITSFTPDGDETERHIVRHGDRFLLYKAGVHVVVEDRAVELQVTSYLQSTGKGKYAKVPFVRDVVLNIKALCDLGPDVPELPLNIVSSEPLQVEPSSLMNFKNGLVDIERALADPQGVELIPHSPQHVSTSQLPYDFIPNAPCEAWQAFLPQVLGPNRLLVHHHKADHSDDHRIEVFQEFVGLSLLKERTSLERALVFTGDGSNGKSTAFRVWQELLGKSNVSHLSLNDISRNFQLQTLRDRRLNLTSEIDHIDRLQEGVFKELVSGDEITVDIKFKNPVTFRPNCVFAFATNHVPRFNDRSEGVWRRLCVMPFFESFGEDSRDIRLTDNLLAELPGIFNWALEGARRLQVNGRLSRCSVCESSLRRHRTESDPVRMYVEDKLAVDRDDSLSVQSTEHLFDVYQQWAKECNYKPLGLNEFARQIQPILVMRGASHGRHDFRGVRKMSYRGVRFTSAA
jgi:P4 family phage/plasmid primase-like protien